MATGQPSPTTMRAVRLHAGSEPRGLRLDTVDVPRPQEGEALVRVHAAAITRGELEWPADRLPAIPSYELSGTVAALGRDVSGLPVGTEVFALTGFERDGAAAEYVAVPAARLAPKPEGLGHATSAALTLAGLSAWQGLFDHGRLADGERVAILGAAGGVGHLATQLARRRGADVVEVVSPSDLEEADGFDLVFDTTGGAALRRAATLVRPGGRIVSVAEDPCGMREGLDARYFVVVPNRDQLVELGRSTATGELRVDVDSVFPLESARAAFERSMARGKRGKVVLRVVG